MKFLKMVLLIIAILFIASSNKGESIHDADDIKAEVALVDYAGIWSFNGRYIQLNSDGTWLQVTRVQYNFIPLVGGRSGYFTEVGVGQISIDNFMNGSTWTYHISQNGTERLYILNPLFVMYKVQ
jgi:hypothetical protein